MAAVVTIHLINRSDVNFDYQYKTTLNCSEHIAPPPLIRAGESKRFSFSFQQTASYAITFAGWLTVNNSDGDNVVDDPNSFARPGSPGPTDNPDGPMFQNGPVFMPTTNINISVDWQIHITYNHNGRSDVHVASGLGFGVIGMNQYGQMPTIRATVNPPIRHIENINGPTNHVNIEVTVA